MSGIDVDPVEDADSDALDGDEDEHTIEVTPTDSVSEDGRETIDVEPADGSIDGPDYILYGGKGGVGKTTMAAATALDSARAGTSTLVVSTDPAHSLSDTFETDVPTEPARLREDIPLYAAEIDPEAAMERGQAAFLGGSAADGSDGKGGFDNASDGSGLGEGAAGGPMGDLGGLGGMLGGESPMEALFGGEMPGADEAAAMQLLLEYIDDPRFERVVVDTAPTGHTLRLLKLPELMDTMMGRILKFRQRISGMLEGMKGMFGGQEQPEEDDLEDLNELRDRIERLRGLLRDPARTDFRIVMVPEEMSVLESKRLRSQLEEFEIPVGTVVVNRVMEPLSDVTDDVEGEFLQPNLAECQFCQRRWDVQQDALAEAQDLFRGPDVRRVPLFAKEVRGEAMLGVVAACLR
ncbi:ArsA family ATPase [Natronorubrum daqingense]|uniref:Arsenic-transporting ATPase n=1 Tax=Natronorubrum daqingense TaxID=588898 RepID=A0A1N7BYA7_9EURY|nr:ArsA family ATPase [Natronorubrum daqingense]APX96649.1 arsenic-transporting ATPase [Natronorubrum daqingense]SIR56286.1 arsenite efflux ATP-binding protein ArsA [Natronorubrum daqingense]